MEEKHELHRGHFLVAASIAFAAVLVSGTWIYVSGSGGRSGGGNDNASARAGAEAEARLVAEILPAAGIELPATWQGLGRQLVETGVIDPLKFDLSPEAEEKVARVAQGIYRPCCGNSTHFPDCNHGMAMLSLLELMAAQDVSEEDMYRAALAVNRFWFPDTYINAAKYISAQGGNWKETEPRALLAAEFSSGQGAAAVRAAVEPASSPSGGSCGV